MVPASNLGVDPADGDGDRDGRADREHDPAVLALPILAIARLGIRDIMAIA
jgi:hypothetical protein